MNLRIDDISFNGVIKKSKTKVQNKQTGKFERAYFCEVDCKDRYDCQIFGKLSYDWEYAQGIATSAEWKYGNAKKGYEDPRGHYILKKRNGEILAICRTSEEYGEIKVDYLESKPQNNYRFAGQMILAGIAKEGIKKGFTRMIIPSPVQGTHCFYNGACGFQLDNKEYIMEKEGMVSFSKCKPKQR